MSEEFAPLRQLGDPAEGAVCVDGVCIVPGIGIEQASTEQEAGE
ncbi:MAG TPA: hypothetical protein VKU39_17715 [Streptosporangiaceae bacterium]|nr:hypothetical protein [Streptosporangiaceae bacterium]